MQADESGGRDGDPETTGRVKISPSHRRPYRAKIAENTVFAARDRFHAGIVWVDGFDRGGITSPFRGFNTMNRVMDKYTDIKATWIVPRWKLPAR